jgi:hypothetical protein
MSFSFDPTFLGRKFAPVEKIFLGFQLGWPARSYKNHIINDLNPQEILYGRYQAFRFGCACPDPHTLSKPSLLSTEGSWRVQRRRAGSSELVVCLCFALSCQVLSQTTAFETHAADDSTEAKSIPNVETTRFFDTECGGTGSTRATVRRRQVGGLAATSEAGRMANLGRHDPSQ